MGVDRAQSGMDMVWAVGGVVLWMGGWWFTGRLFSVYRKAVYLEEMDRRRGVARDPGDHHTGTLLFVFFDLGLLLLGIRSLAVLLAGSEASGDADASLMAHLVEWSILMCLYVFRQAVHLHRLYHDRVRARTGRRGTDPWAPGTVRAIWRETPPVLRVGWILAPLLALVPLVASPLGLGSDLVTPDVGDALPVVLWLLVPQALLALVLASPLTRLRRRVRTGSP